MERRRFLSAIGALGGASVPLAVPWDSALSAHTSSTQAVTSLIEASKRLGSIVFRSHQRVSDIAGGAPGPIDSMYLDGDNEGIVTRSGYRLTLVRQGKTLVEVCNGPRLLQQWSETPPFGKSRTLYLGLTPANKEPETMFALFVPSPRALPFVVHQRGNGGVAVTQFSREYDLDVVPAGVRVRAIRRFRRNGGKHWEVSIRKSIEWSGAQLPTECAYTTFDSADRPHTTVITEYEYLAVNDAIDMQLFDLERLV